MNEFEKAIEWLSRRGYEARYREWSLGESVVVCTGTVRNDIGIEVMQGMHYLFKNDNVWVITNFDPNSQLENNPEYQSRSLTIALAKLEKLLEQSRVSSQNA